jgi:lipoprotein-anchoring transpeptidase ErfK/SrfK
MVPMRRSVVLFGALLLAGCGSRAEDGARTNVKRPAAPPARRCTAGTESPLGSGRRAYLGSAKHGAVAYARPGRRQLARFGATNVNGYPTVFGVVGEVVKRDCAPAWFRVQLPIKPNGSLGYVRASSLALETVATRIVVDISARRLDVYERGRRTLSATVAVGSAATPTPVGHYYVNQRLIPTDAAGPYGPAAIGISAYSTVLTGWTQGGPIAIHGTNEPQSIGRPVSNGCIRLPNATLRQVFSVAYAGTPVIIRA